MLTQIYTWKVAQEEHLSFPGLSLSLAIRLAFTPDALRLSKSKSGDVTNPVKIWSKNNNQNGQLSTCLRGCIKQRTATNQSLCVITEPLWTWQWFTIQVGWREQNQQRKQQQRPSVRGMQIHAAEHVRWLMLKAQRNVHVFVCSGLWVELGWGWGAVGDDIMSPHLQHERSRR